MLYITQERAFAPGICSEWPNIIPHPTNPNGRLKKIDIHDLLVQIDSELSAIASGRPISSKEELRDMACQIRQLYEGKT